METNAVYCMQIPVGGLLLFSADDNMEYIEYNSTNLEPGDENPEIKEEYTYGSNSDSSDEEIEIKEEYEEYYSTNLEIDGDNIERQLCFNGDFFQLEEYSTTSSNAIGENMEMNEVDRSQSLRCANNGQSAESGCSNKVLSDESEVIQHLCPVGNPQGKNVSLLKSHSHVDDNPEHTVVATNATHEPATSGQQMNDNDPPSNDQSTSKGNKQVRRKYPCPYHFTATWVCKLTSHLRHTHKMPRERAREKAKEIIKNTKETYTIARSNTAPPGLTENAIRKAHELMGHDETHADSTIECLKFFGFKLKTGIPSSAKNTQKETQQPEYFFHVVDRYAKHLSDSKSRKSISAAQAISSVIRILHNITPRNECEPSVKTLLDAPGVIEYLRTRTEVAKDLSMSTCVNYVCYYTAFLNDLKYILPNSFQKQKQSQEQAVLKLNVYRKQLLQTIEEIRNKRFQKEARTEIRCCKQATRFKTNEKLQIDIDEILSKSDDYIFIEDDINTAVFYIYLSTCMEHGVSDAAFMTCMTEELQNERSDDDIMKILLRRSRNSGKSTGKVILDKKAVDLLQVYRQKMRPQILQSNTQLTVKEKNTNILFLTTRGKNFTQMTGFCELMQQKYGFEITTHRHKDKQSQTDATKTPKKSFGTTSTEGENRRIPENEMLTVNADTQMQENTYSRERVSCTDSECRENTKTVAETPCSDGLPCHAECSTETVSQEYSAEDNINDTNMPFPVTTDPVMKIPRMASCSAMEKEHSDSDEALSPICGVESPPSRTKKLQLTEDSSDEESLHVIRLRINRKKLQRNLEKRNREYGTKSTEGENANIAENELLTVNTDNHIQGNADSGERTSCSNSTCRDITKTVAETPHPDSDLAGCGTETVSGVATAEDKRDDTNPSTKISRKESCGAMENGTSDSDEEAMSPIHRVASTRSRKRTCMQKQCSSDEEYQPVSKIRSKQHKLLETPKTPEKRKKDFFHTSPERMDPKQFHKVFRDHPATIHNKPLKSAEFGLYYPNKTAGDIWKLWMIYRNRFADIQVRLRFQHVRDVLDKRTLKEFNDVFDENLWKRTKVVNIYFGKKLFE